jgi:hypothetical protein
VHFPGQKVTSLSVDAQWAFVKDLVALVEREGAAYDIATHRDAPPEAFPLLTALVRSVSATHRTWEACTRRVQDRRCGAA